MRINYSTDNEAEGTIARRERGTAWINYVRSVLTLNFGTVLVSNPLKIFPAEGSNRIFCLVYERYSPLSHLIHSSLELFRVAPSLRVFNSTPHSTSFLIPEKIWPNRQVVESTSNLWISFSKSARRDRLRSKVCLRFPKAEKCAEIGVLFLCNGHPNDGCFISEWIFIDGNGMSSLSPKFTSFHFLNKKTHQK